MESEIVDYDGQGSYSYNGLIWHFSTYERGFAYPDFSSYHCDLDVRIILFKRITIWEVEIVRAVGLTCGKIFQRVIVKPAAINPKDQVIVHLGFVARVTDALTCTRCHR